MKLFKCTHCGQVVYFENDKCEQCHNPLGFVLEQQQVVALYPQPHQQFKQCGQPEGTNYKYCANHAHDVCNWLLPAASPDALCKACSLNQTIPKLDEPEHLERWRTLERAKHRLVYSLLQLQLPVVSKTDNADTGLAFDFLSDAQKPKGEKVMTGHDNGLITINIAEADDVEREMARRNMDEVYRTVLGHFRHEVGHYYFDRLIDNTPNLEPFRKLFGDERADYGASLKTHYDQGPPANWQQEFISAYATTHPWEDWAETWAHYLHIIDTLQTASAFGLRVRPQVAEADDNLTAEITHDPYTEASFDRIMEQWLPLTLALNSLNRSMGLPDSYPFVIPPKVVEKLTFIHGVCRSAAGKAR
ncbi:zinc-binding metallopeptidase family protein [Hymenobacter latericus]|uniref:zinc-binding metallopeptidase family protein n=1 Tax=Hymenobacter sp. YIM 151858-1 TaxID=2987688 RepID=UPI0022266586|nr:putative zinc-binding peptidase [Hymenobacter sp. YIM 151858-1]UYZ59672.1 putative zinc-binding peptidase [Hymenobacter sp. YIM 151858-1]